MHTPIIIALSGKKGSGKNTIAKYIHSYAMDHLGGGKFMEYSFADLLKEFCVNVLGLEHHQCFGSDDEKNTSTKYHWGSTPNIHKTGDMTGREVMQVFGTECVRAWFGNVWADATIRRIYQEYPKIALITDTRFINEVDEILEQPKGYVIRLTRSPYDGDGHASETALDSYDWDRERCFILDNANLSIDEQNNQASPILKQIFS